MAAVLGLSQPSASRNRRTEAAIFMVVVAATMTLLVTEKVKRLEIG